MKLFATDLDGTLLDPDGNIHPRDARAIAAALAQGVVVTIATGRLTRGTHPVAQALGLTAPLVCADGGVTSCAVTERVLSRRPLEQAHTEKVVGEIVRRGLASFVFTADAIHACERGREHHRYVRGWSPAITTHRDVLEAEAWRDPEDAPVMALGIGDGESVIETARQLEETHPELDVATFTFWATGAWVVRVLRGGVSKGAALDALTKELGIRREDCAVIGDWLNDLSMFAWAERAYAMPHAHDDVKAAATHTLPDDACKRGAIADALEDFLGKS